MQQSPSSAALALPGKRPVFLFWPSRPDRCASLRVSQARTRPERSVGAGLPDGAQTGPGALDELADAASEAAGPLVDATGGDTPQVVMTPASAAATPPSQRIPWSPVFKSARKTLTTPGSVVSMLEMALSDNDLDILDNLRRRWQPAP